MGRGQRRQVNSFLLSLIFHIFILVFLALSTKVEYLKIKPIQISVEFQQVSDIVLTFDTIELPRIVDSPEQPEDIDFLNDNAADIIDIKLSDFPIAQPEPLQVKGSGPPSSNIKKGTGDGNKNSKDIANFKKRLSKYKGKTGDIQISLLWDNHNDIDLHVKYTNGFDNNRISWMNKRDKSGGTLDVDMNSVTSYRSDHPVENVYWPLGSSPRGTFKVYVHHYTCTGKDLKTPVKIMIKNNDQIKIINTFAVFGESPKEIYSFIR